MERRTIDARVELRGEGEEKRIGGLAAVYYDGTDSTEFRLWDGAVERVMPGAFDQAIESDDVRALFNHDPNQVLGRKQAGTLALRSTKHGLDYEIDPGDTTVARDVSEHLRRGDVTGSSFSFRIRGEGETRGERWIEDGDRMVREVTSAQLYDVGPVTFPAYSGATSGLRSEDLAEARSSYEKTTQADDRRQRDADLQRQKEIEVTIWPS